MEKEKIKELLYRYQTNQCSEEEKAWVESLYNKITKDSTADIPEDVIKKDLHDIYKTLPTPNSVKIMHAWPQLVAAAIIILFLSVGLYTYLKKNTQPQQHVAYIPKVIESGLAPGTNKAILTLADGSTIYLDTAANGKLAEQRGFTITKNKDGLITYSRVQNIDKATNKAEFNTISTPNGGQYQMVLPDGTKVWLNAASSLKYPISFFGKERKVELKGEGYFEVAKNQDKPFKVLTEYQEVEVLGTHFNINSYADEPATKTTLLEGSVKISQLATQSSIFLKPGEQSTVKEKDEIKVSKVNVANTIAWKNGLFQFQDSGIRNVMRQIARWYDVQVEFEGEIPNIKLWGEVYRNANAIETLEMLSYFDLNYQIVTNGETKKIIILNNK